MCILSAHIPYTSNVCYSYILQMNKIITQWDCLEHAKYSMIAFILLEINSNK